MGQKTRHPAAAELFRGSLVSVIQGRGLDYVVDLRRDSASYLRWNSIELQGHDPKLVYIPAGFGHAFLSMEDNTIELFSIDQPFENGIGNVIHYTDPSIRLALPQKPKYLSDYDRNAPFLK